MSLHARTRPGLRIIEPVYRRREGSAFRPCAVHCAFDLLELDGRYLRREPIEERKRLLAKLLRRSNLSIVLNEHFEEDDATVFREACKPRCCARTATSPISPMSPLKAPA
jgi:hypothetical protein